MIAISSLVTLIQCPMNCVDSHTHTRKLHSHFSGTGANNFNGSYQTPTQPGAANPNGTNVQATGHPNEAYVNAPNPRQPDVNTFSPLYKSTKKVFSQ